MITSNITSVLLTPNSPPTHIPEFKERVEYLPYFMFSLVERQNLTKFLQFIAVIHQTTLGNSILLKPVLSTVTKDSY